MVIFSPKMDILGASRRSLAPYEVYIENVVEKSQISYIAKLNLNSIQFNSIQINWGWDSLILNFSNRHIGSATNSTHPKVVRIVH